MHEKSFRLRLPALLPLLLLGASVALAAAIFLIYPGYATSFNASIDNGPLLTIPLKIYAQPQSIVEVPVQFYPNGNAISSIVFSIDYDENWLAFDSNISNAITFNLPVSFVGSCSPDLGDADGELDCFIMDPASPLSPLPDGVLLTIQLKTLSPASSTEAKVGFSQSSPMASFGDTEGQSVTGSTLDGSVLISYESPTITPESTTPPGITRFVYIPCVQHSIDVPIPTTEPQPTATSTTEPHPTATPAPQACSDRIGNGSFETTSDWDIISTVYKAGYSTSVAHGGLRSMRTGITDKGGNIFSYSSVSQKVSIPSGAKNAQLKFWRYTTSGETARPPSFPAIPESQAFGEMPIGSDLYYVIVLDAGDNWIDTLLWDLNNTPVWNSIEFDLADHIGKNIKIQFGTFNDGQDGVSAMFIDDVSLTVCP